MSRKLQQSLAETYEPTPGAFAQAYLNHGIQPQGDGYQYVLIPADQDAQKLEQLASDLAALYQLLNGDAMH